MAKPRVWHLKLSRSKNNDLGSMVVYEIDIKLPDGTKAAIDFAVKHPIDIEDEAPIVDAIEYCERILKAMGVSGRCTLKIQDICEMPVRI